MNTSLTNRVVCTKLIQKISLAVAALALLGGSVARAASSTWLDTGTTSSLWGDPTNWVGGVVPGNTSAGVTANTDTATFNTAVGTEGTSANPITIDNGRTIGGITFASGAGNFYIGTTSGNTLYLNSGGTILDSGTGVETINAPLVIAGAAGNSYTFSNTSTGSLNFGGAITSAAPSGATTLNLSGTSGNTVYNNISGVISNGTGNSLALNHSTGANWTLSGANTYTGGTTISAGVTNAGNNSALGTGTLTDAGGALGASVSGVSLANNISITGGAFFIGQGGTSDVTNNLTFTGTVGGTSAATVLDTELTTGVVSFTGGTINISPGSAASTLTLNNQYGTTGSVMNIGSVIRNGGTGVGSLVVGTNDVGTLSVILSGANTYTGNTTLTSGVIDVGSNTALGIGGTVTLGSGASLGASVSGTSVANNITNSANFYVGKAGSTDVSNSITFTGTVTPTVTATTIDDELTTGVATFSGGTIKISPSTTASTLTLNNQYGTSGAVLNISSTIQNGGSAAGSLIVGTNDVGTPIFNISGANTYSGGTTLTSGVLNVGNNAALGTGALNINGGVIGASTSGITLANNITNTTGTIYVGQTGTSDTANGLTFSGTVTPVMTASTIDTELGSGIVAAFTGGTININPSTTASTLTLNNASGTSGSVITIGSVIQNGGAAAGSLVVGSANDVGTFTANLSGANTYTGSTTVNNGATLNESGTLASTTLVLGGGTFNAAGSASPSFTTTTLNVGASSVSDTGTGTLGLGTITHNVGGLLDVLGTGVTATNANVNGILGGWATYGTGTSTAFASNLSPGTSPITAVVYNKQLPVGGDTTTSDNDNLSTPLPSGTTQTQTAASTINTLTITDATANDTLALSTFPLTFTSGGGLLYNGGSTFNITSSSIAGIIGAGAANEFDVNVTPGGTLTIGAPVVGTTGAAGSLVLGGGGKLDLTSAASSFTGITSIGNGSTLQIGGAGTLGTTSGGTYAGAIADNGTLEYSSTASQTLSGVISGTGGITKDTGTSTLNLSGTTNTYTGPTVVNAGILEISSGASLGATPASYVANQITLSNGGTILINANGTSLATNQGITLGSGGGELLTNNVGQQNDSVNSIISGSGGPLTVSTSGSGARALIINGANTYTGGTFITAGGVTAGNASALGTGTVTLSGGAVWTIASGATPTANAVAIASGSTGQLIANVGSTNGTESGAITLAGSSASTTISLGDDNVGGATLIITGGITGMGNVNTSPGGVRGGLQINTGAVNNVGTFTNGSAGTTTTVNAVIGANVTGVIQNSTSSPLVLNAANLYASPTQILQGTLNTASLANSGLASGIGEGASSTPSATDLVFGNTGGTLQYNANTAPQVTNRLFTIGNAGSTTTASATLDSSSALAANYVDFDGTGAIAFGDATVNSTNTLTLTGTNTGNNELDPTLGDGANGKTSLVKSGAGKWILGGADTYTGTTTISAGTLQLGNGTNNTGSISASSAITDTGTFAVDRNGTATQGTDFGLISGTAGAFTQLGTGTTIFIGTNTYTGATTVTAGTLQLGNGTTNGTTTNGTIGTSGVTVTTPGVLVFDESGNIAESAATGAVISGTGSVVQNGMGVLTLDKNNTFSGGLTVSTAASFGSVNGAGAQPLGEGTVTLAGANTSTGLLTYTGASGSLNDGFVITGQGSIISDGGSVLTLAGPISKNGSVLNLIGGSDNPGTFVVTGVISGTPSSALNVTNTTVTLSAANTYNGPTTISGNSSPAGTNALRTAIANALPSSSLVTLGSTTQEGTNTGITNILDLDGTAQSIGGLASDNDAADTNEVINSTGGNYKTANTATSLAIAPAAGTVDTFAGLVGGSGGVGNFSVTVTGPGTEVFTGANTYTNGTTISGGTLYANNTSGSATGTGAVLVSTTATTSGTLAGNGTVSGPVTLTSTSGHSATLSSGASQVGNATGSVRGPGLTLMGGLTVNGGSTLAFSLGVNGAPASSFSLANPNTDSTYLNVAATGNIFANTTTADVVNLTNLVIGSSPLAYPYLLIADVGTNVGTDADFSNLFTSTSLDGSNPTEGVNGYVVGIDNGSGGYTAITLANFDANGNSQALLPNEELYLQNGELLVTPEPTTWAMLLGGVALLVAIQRRRRAARF